MHPETAQATTASILFMCAPPSGAHSSSPALPARPAAPAAAALLAFLCRFRTGRDRCGRRGIGAHDAPRRLVLHARPALPARRGERLAVGRAGPILESSAFPTTSPRTRK